MDTEKKTPQTEKALEMTYAEALESQKAEVAALTEARESDPGTAQNHKCKIYIKKDGLFQSRLFLYR